MESGRRRVLTRRNPLSDCTNTSSSSSAPPKPSKPYHSSSSSSRFNKPPTKTTNLDSATNPTSPSPPVLSTPSIRSPSSHGIVDVEASEPISVVYSRRRSRNERSNDKGKEVAVAVSSTPISEISNNRKISDRLEGENLPKAKALTVPRRKKQRTQSSEDALKDPVLQDIIEKQKAYFKMIDEFKLSEEEVESSDELE